ncbi:MAG: EamA family transporter [Dehalococcoidia bacterium]
MRADIFALATSTIAIWGLFGLFSKLAIERIDQQVILWGSLVAGPIVFFTYLAGSGHLLPVNFHPSGITFGLLAGTAGCTGTVLFYQLLAREPASLAVPLTSLYPAVTVVLAAVFLNEELAFTRIVGIAFALTAVFLLSR